MNLEFQGLRFLVENCWSAYGKREVSLPVLSEAEYNSLWCQVPYHRGWNRRANPPSGTTRVEVSRCPPYFYAELRCPSWARFCRHGGPTWRPASAAWGTTSLAWPLGSRYR